MEADGLIPLSQDESDLQSKVEIPDSITFEMEHDMSKFTAEAKPILTAAEQQALNERLIIAIENSAQQEDVAKIIEAGADVNAKDEDGYNALMMAAIRGRTEIVQILIEKGEDVNAQNNNGSSALMLAAVHGRTEIVQILIEKGADVNAQDINGRTALVRAQSRHQTESAHVLEAHNQRLESIATLLIDDTKRDAKGHINLKTLDADQQKLLENIYKFNRDNISDAIKLKLVEKGVDADQAKDQAVSVIDDAKSHYLNTIDKAKSYKIAKAGREEGRSFPKGNIDITADIVRFLNPEDASNLSKALAPKALKNAASLGKKMLPLSSAPVAVAASTKTESLTQEELMRQARLTKFDLAKNYGDDRKPSGATPPSPQSKGRG